MSSDDPNANRDEANSALFKPGAAARRHGGVARTYCGVPV
jgi:hypothetical protein